MNNEAQTVFRAIADPTRRAIIDLLAGQELTAGEVASEFSMSRPAVAKHLKILKEGGIVADRTEGRRRYNRLEAARLKILSEWVRRYERFWDQALERLKIQVEQDYKSAKENKS